LDNKGTYEGRKLKSAKRKKKERKKEKETWQLLKSSNT